MSPPCHHHNHHSPSYDHYYYNDYQSLRSALMSLEESTTTSRSDESSSNPQRQHDDGRQRLPQHYRYHDTNQHDRTHQDHGKRQHYESCVTGNYTSCINTNGSRKRPRGASTAATTGGNKIVHGVSMTFLLMILVATSCPSFVTSLSGLVYTKSGYDNPSGSNPICWSSPSFHNKSLSHDHDEHDEDHDDDRDDHEDHVDDEVLDHQEDDGGDHSGSNSTTSSNTTTIDNISNATTDVPTGNFTNVIPSNATAAARAIDFAHEVGEHEDNSGHHDLRLNHDDELLQDFDGKVWESILFPNFVAGPVTMEAECPPSVRLHVDVPHEHVKGEVLRTDTVYHYHVELEFDMDELRSYYGLSQDAHVVSESGDPVFALQIKMCEVNGNFCTPFAEKHDHTEENHGKTEDGHDDHDDHGLDDHDDHDSHSVYEEDDHDSHGAQEGEHDHDHRRLYVRRNVNRRSRGAIPQKNELRRLQKHIPDVIKDDLLKDYLYESHDDEGSDGHAAHGAHEDDLAVDTAILESPIVLIPVLENQTLVHIDLDVPVDLHVPGVFLPLATLQLFLSNATIHGHLPGLDEVAAFKVDIANALHQRSLIYQAPAEIRKVTRLAAIASYILVFSCTVFGMWLLYMVYRYREEKIMVLSQGTFLAVFQAAGILATTCCVLFEPKTDKFCYLSGPLVVLPMHFMLAILFGRLRRIITVMSPIMELGNASVSSLPNAESDGLKGFRRHLSAGVKKRKNLRQEFSAWRSWRVIFLFTIPQIILQIVQEAVYPPHLTLVLNVDGSIGRYQCGDNISQWIQFGELLCVYLGLIALVVESQRSKNLPALFNEAASISQASVGTIFIATAGLMIVVFSRDPTSSPDVRYIMLVFVVLAFVVNLSFRLVVPKLQLIWSGEKVVVSRILRDHRNSKMFSVQSEHSSFRPAKNWASTVDKKPTLDLGAGVNLTSSAIQATSSKDDYEVPLRSPVKRISWTGEANVPSESMLSNSAVEFSSMLSPDPLESNGVDDPVAVAAVPPPPLAEGDQVVRRSAVSSSHHESQSSESTDMLIAPGVAPPSKVTLAINEQTHLLSRINDRILSGLEVSKKDWEELRSSFGNMNEFFGQLRYEWDGEQKEE